MDISSMRRSFLMATGIAAAVAMITVLSPASLLAEGNSLFDGKTLDGWEGDTATTWKVEEGCITAGDLTRTIPRNEFLSTTKTYGDFELKVKIKLLGDKNKANAGIQFRTKRIPNHHEVIGYQADAGPDNWGALYDESRRKKVLARPDAKVLDGLVRHEDWNEYAIRCEGPRVRLWLNGKLTVDYVEPDGKIEQSGVIALQIHGGAANKVFYKDIQIEELTAATKPGTVTWPQDRFGDRPQCRRMTNCPWSWSEQ